MDFRLGLGHPALDLIATLGARRAAPIERLAQPADLDRWLAEAGLLRGPHPRTATRPVTRAQLTAARELREAIYRALEAARESRLPPDGDRKLINRWARGATATPQLGPDLSCVIVGPDAATAALSQIAREAVELLTGPQLARVRTCDGCSLIFLDRSRPGRRRWCSMDRCGNKSKTARYRAKRAEHA
jgi:predicted RNA-binding Zn ribbon-like protein